MSTKLKTSLDLSTRTTTALGLSVRGTILIQGPDQRDPRSISFKKKLCNCFNVEDTKPTVAFRATDQRPCRKGIHWGWISVLDLVPEAMAVNPIKVLDDSFIDCPNIICREREYNWIDKSKSAPIIKKPGTCIYPMFHLMYQRREILNWGFSIFLSSITET